MGVWKSIASDEEVTRLNEIMQGAPVPAATAGDVFRDLVGSDTLADEFIALERIHPLGDVRPFVIAYVWAYVSRDGWMQPMSPRPGRPAIPDGRMHWLIEGLFGVCARHRGLPVEPAYRERLDQFAREVGAAIDNGYTV